MKRAFKYKLRTIIPFVVFLFFIMSTTFIVVNNIRNTKIETIKSLEKNLKSRIFILQNNLNDLYSLNLYDMVSRRLAEFCLEPQINIFALADENGIIQYSNYSERLGTDVDKLEGYEESKAANYRGKTGGQFVVANKYKFRVYLSVNMGFVPGEIRTAKEGLIYFIYDFSSDIHKARIDAYQQGAIFGMIGLLAALIISLVLNRIINKPVAQINNAMKKFAEGDLSVRLNQNGKNELAILAKGFDKMAWEIEKKSENLKLMEFIIEHSADSIFLIREDSSFEYVNNAACLELCYSKDELLNLSVTDVDINQTKEIWKSVWEGIKVPGQLTLDSTHITKDGSPVPVNIVGIYFNFGGTEYICAIVRNIAERKKFEEELIVSKERSEHNEREYRNLYDNAIEGMFRTSLQGNGLRSNKALALLLGFETAEEALNYITDTTNQVWYNPDDRIDFLKQLSMTNILRDYECKFKRKNGDIIWVSVNAKLVIEEGGNNSYIEGYIVDITKRKIDEELLIEQNKLLERQYEEYMQLNETLRQTNFNLEIAKEKAEESDKLKTAFLCNISHEIRTPLNAILGFGSLLNDTELTQEERNDYYGIVKSRSDDLLHIINDLLDISSIESNQMTIHETEAKISETLNELYLIYELKIDSESKSDVKLKLNNEISDEDFSLITDIDKVEQILGNLLNNAIKFTHRGAIEFGCRILNENEILFYVADTGIGIPNDEISKIFERFRQGEVYLTRQYGGTGLGLSISKGLVELMLGKIWVESTLNVGSTFYFSIPFKQSEQQKETESLPDLSKFDFQNKKVLIVEDDEFNMYYLEKLVKDLKLNYLSAPNGNTALELFREHTDIDLVLMDIQLPDISGYELTKIMKQSNKDIPIVAQTAFAMEEDRQKCFEAGCDEYTHKPVSKENLYKKIIKYLG